MSRSANPAGVIGIHVFQIMTNSRPAGSRTGAVPTGQNLLMQRERMDVIPSLDVCPGQFLAGAQSAWMVLTQRPAGLVKHAPEIINSHADPSPANFLDDQKRILVYQVQRL
jgi:hypothetical protein